jgi:hypothetical protein
MSTLVFDTLEYANKLKDAGFTQQQAEVLAKEQATLVENNLATTRDLKELELRLFVKIGSMIVGATAILLAANFFAA